MSPRILLVEDDPLIGASLQRALDANGYSADWVTDGAAALAAARSGRPSLVLLDLASGERTVLADEPEHEFYAPLISPDGTRAVIVVDRKSTPERAPRPVN